MKEPIRVLHILQRMEAGGTQALLMNIYRKIDRSKIQFDFLVVYQEEQFYDRKIPELGGRLYKLSFREDLNLLKFRRDLDRFFSEHKEYRIVHCHAYTFGYFCLKAAEKHGVPVRIAHSHSNEAVRDVKYLLKRFMQKLFCLHATHRMACSQEAGKYLFKDREYTVLPNAIDSGRFIAEDEIRADVRKELGVENRFVIGHVGRFQPEKNHEFLLEVYREVLKSKPDAVLLLIGKGALKERIREEVNRCGLTDSVLFLENRNDMFRLYQAMDVFVFPSRFEGLGIVAIEAQAAGIPLICSEGLPPETEITELYVRLQLQEGAGKWAETAIRIAENPAAHTNMQQRIIDAGFDMDSSVHMLEQYYLSIYR